MSHSPTLPADSTPPVIDFPAHLPVSARREAIAAALAASQVVIVCGETGSGKTTQLPKIALLAGRGREGLIGMTQPRRIAARSVAQRLAEETRSRLGGFVGWQVRFHDHIGPESRIKVMTDGILLAETQSDPEFRAYDTLILDEAHERSLNIDFLLGYLKTLLPRRPGLRLILSSATLEADRFSRFFGEAPIVEVSGRTYPVEMRYRPPEPPSNTSPPSRPPPLKGGGGLTPSPLRGEGWGGGEEDADLDAALLAAVDELAREGPGDILVFLPGEREIREAHESLRKHHPPHTEILPLFARLSVAEQERVFQPHGGRRIVLATNVAETSLTVPGIHYVVDTGLARVKRYSLRNRIEQLKIERIAQASANQRAGRCGRLADGVCIRLYAEEDFQSRPPYTTPELLRSSLAGVILRMKALGLPDIEAFPFPDPPESKRVRDGQALLAELGALDGKGGLTAIGRQLARLAVDPRIGRMLLAAKEKAQLHEVLIIAAFLSVQDPRERPLDRQEAADQKHRRFADEHSDFVAILNLWRHIDQLNAHRKSHNKYRQALKDDFLSPNRVREWRDIYNQLSVQVKELGWQVSTLLPQGREGNSGSTASRPHSRIEVQLDPWGAERGPGMRVKRLHTDTATQNTTRSPSPPTPSTVGIAQPTGFGGGEQYSPKPRLHPPEGEGRTAYAPLHQALLTGLLGNLGMLTENGDYLGARGMRFLPFPGSGVKKKAKWIMAAEIVETRRVYARTMARIEPEWIEHAGRHLLKVSYSDPHWAKRPAHVAAAMRATLYGLPVVNARRVHYGPIDPVLSREIFIRGALVAGEYDTRAAFFAHNRRLLAQIEDLSHRSRNARLTVDEEVLYAWYDERIPEGIHNGAAFEKWLLDLSARSPRLLHLTRQDLLREKGADPDAFPHELDLNGVRFALAYRFDPGTADDGVTLLVPLPALNQVPEMRCDWLVPGLLEEKIAALIKGLPQSVRRAFVPVPEFARAAAVALCPPPPRVGEGLGERGLTDTLADFLARTTGQAVPRDAWRPEALPAHLAMNYRVLDANNRVLAEGRDLAALRRQLGAEASRSLREAAAPQEREEVARWDFGDLPERVELAGAGRRVAAFPSLAEEAGQVRLRLLDSPSLARERHRRGVCRLLWRSFPDLLKQTERDLAARLKGAAMQYALLDKALSLDALLADVLYAAARTALAGDAADLRRQTEFESAAQTVRPRLADAARETARLAAECLDHAHRLARQLGQPQASREAVADMQAQLKALVYPGFVAHTPPQKLPHLPRYLRAMERRLEKLGKNPSRDAQSQRALLPLLTAWQARSRREEDSGGWSPETEDFRWRLEELRVSLFAQELKTPEPVSVKRLEKRWQEIVAGR